MTSKITFSEGEPRVVFVKPNQTCSDPRLQSRYKGVPTEVLDLKEFALVRPLIPWGGLLSRAFSNETITADQIRFPFQRGSVESIEHRTGKIERW